MFFQKGDIKIDGILCEGTVFYAIRLHENRKLKRCALAKTLHINGTEYEGTSKITLDQEENVIKTN